MSTQFKNVRYAMDRIDSLYDRLNRVENFDTLGTDEQAIVTNPMGYLATMFQMDGLWGEDLMYSLATLYKPFLIMGKEITINTKI